MSFCYAEQNHFANSGRGFCETHLCEIILTLKAPRKKYIRKLTLLKSSAANNCLTLLTNLSKETNRVDPDQTAPIGAV